jgi:hypothetical protein
MYATFAKGAKTGPWSKARLNRVQLSMVDMKGRSREAHLSLVDVYPNGSFTIFECYSRLEKV